MFTEHRRQNRGERLHVLARCSRAADRNNFISRCKEQHIPVEYHYIFFLSQFFIYEDTICLLPLHFFISSFFTYGSPSTCLSWLGYVVSSVSQSDDNRYTWIANLVFCQTLASSPLLQRQWPSHLAPHRNLPVLCHVAKPLVVGCLTSCWMMPHMI